VRTVLAVIGLCGLSLALRAPGVGGHLWMDEGIAVGIAQHSLVQIPGLLRLDGSPPLYYVLLHVWMSVAGTSDVAVHWLSVVVATLCVPAAWWAGAAAGGWRTGGVLAVLVACCPLLTSHAREARMYPLVVLLGLLWAGCFVQVFVRGRRGYAVGFGVTLAALLYTHNWALFVACAAVPAVVVAGGDRRRAVLGFGVAALLYAPWLPTLLFQARHTGAPWATAPSPAALVRAPEAALGGVAAAVVALLAALAGVRRRLGAALALLTVGPLLLAWVAAQRSHAWDPRYLAVIVAPGLMLAALGLVRARMLGVAGLAVLVVLSAQGGRTPGASDAFALGRAAAPVLRRGDLVIATPFAQVPLLARYLPGGLRYASTLGPAADPHVVDWSDVTQRLARAPTRGTLPPLLDHVRVGSDVLLVVPVAWDARSARTALGREERARSSGYIDALLRDPRFRPVAVLPQHLPPLPRTWMVRGLVLRRI
jgi:mannosyltransferase